MKLGTMAFIFTTLCTILLNVVTESIMRIAIMLSVIIMTAVALFKYKSSLKSVFVWVFFQQTSFNLYDFKLTQNFFLITYENNRAISPIRWHYQSEV